MWFKISLLAILVRLVCGLEHDIIALSVDYFNYRNVKEVCLLTCDKKWSHKISKSAFDKQITVSKVHIDGLTIINKLNVCLKQRFTSVGVIIDSKCPRFENVMNFASTNMMFDSMHKWLIVENDLRVSDSNITNAIIDEENKTIAFNISKAVTVIENLNTSVDSDIVIAFRKFENETEENNKIEEHNIVTVPFVYDLYEAFNFGKVQGGNLNLNVVGFWSVEAGLFMVKNLNNYKYYARWDFKKWAMRMIVVFSNPPKHFDPEMMIGRVPAPGVAVITQTTATVLHVIAELHNFRFVYTLGERWIGSYEPNQTKVVATALHYGYQDISPLIRRSSYTLGKIDIVHPPLSSIETRFYYRIPTFGPGKFENQFLRPFATGSWLCSVAVISLCAIVLLLAALLEQRPMPVQYAAFSVAASFCQQFFDDSSDDKSRRRSQARRITVFVTGLSCVLLYNYYTSSVVSWLLNGPPPSITSLEELLESPLELILEDIGYARSWIQSPDYYFNIKNAKVEDAMRWKKVFNKKKGEPLLVTVNEGIDLLKAGGYAYHTEVNTANMLISRKFDQVELCELGSLQSMEKTLVYAAVQKNSPYKEFLIWSISRLSERGIISCIQRRTASQPVYCEGSSPRALALGGAAPAFLLLAFGYLLATVILIFERVMHRRFGIKL